MKPHILLLFF